MNETHCSAGQSTVFAGLLNLLRGLGAGLCILLSACGGSADAPPPPQSGPVVPTAVPPTITLQPVSQSVTTGQPASFSVAASGTALITWQWQRNGVAIAGATTTTYTIASTAMTDSGAVFSAVATNVAGSATSENANLTVTAAAPVLTITQQPASLTVVAGTTATFTVGATCSSGTLDIQWRRTNHFDIDPFVDIAGATSASYSLMASTTDGAVFEAVLDCSGQSTTKSAFATLTVTSPSSVTLSLLPLTGLRAQADVHNPGAIVEDNQNSYSFIASNRIKRLSADLTTITTVAGSGVVGSADGPGQTATFQGPAGITRDASGTLYVTDDLTIRRITADGTVTTLAGSANQSGLTDGTGAAARFHGPFGIAIGPEGDLYVADTVSVRRVTSAGVVTTYAGGGGTLAGLGGPAASVRFAVLTGIAVSPTGDVYVSDSGLNQIFLIARVGGIGGTAGNVSAIAGDGTDNETDGVGTLAQIGRPTTMCMSGGALYVADESFSIRKIDLATLAVTTFAGASTAPHGEIIDGPVGMARFRVPEGLAASTLGGLLLTDSFTIRHIDATGTAVTIAMSTVEDVNAVGQGTLMQLPFNATAGTPGLVVEPGQSVVVSTETLLRRISPTGVVTLIAGLPAIPYIAGDGPIDGNASGAQFGEYEPPLVRDSTGTIYLGDLYGVRKVTTDGTVSFIAGSAAGLPGQVDGNGSAATFNVPTGIAIGPNGDLFVSDLYEIRRVTTAGVVTTYAGNGTRGQADGPVASARFVGPSTLAFAPDGTLYIVDGNVIRTISPDGRQVSTLAGPTLTGALGGTGMAVDNNGALYYSGSANGGQTGLRQRTAAGVDTLLIPQGSSVVLGSSPSTPPILAIAVYGPKQLLLSTGQQGLFYVATLP